MKTLEQFRDNRPQIPMTTSWYLSDVGRYISLERLIEENKERYYETLKRLKSQNIVRCISTGRNAKWERIR